MLDITAPCQFLVRAAPSIPPLLLVSGPWVPLVHRQKILTAHH